MYNNTNWHIPNNAILFILATNIFKNEIISRQYYIGVNHKCPESFYPIFLPDQVTQAQTWGTVVTPYSRRRL